MAPAPAPVFSAYAPTSGAAFVPPSFGNAVALYPSATFSSGQPAPAGKSSTNSGKSKGKGRGGEENDGSSVQFVEYDELPGSRRKFVTETYTVFASLQKVAASARAGELGGDGLDLDDNDDYAYGYSYGRAVVPHKESNAIPSPALVAYFSRFAQLYTDCLARYASELSAEDSIDTKELGLIQTLRDAFRLLTLIYVPSDGRGDGIVSEELVDQLNALSPWPLPERIDHLTSLSAPYEDPDFWGFVYASVLRGKLALAGDVLRKLLSHPSPVLQRLTQACLDLLKECPRSSSPAFAYEAAFVSAVRKWRTKLAGVLARLDSEMDEFLEEITADASDKDGEHGDEEDERYEWQAGFKCLLLLLSGDANTVLDASEDGWRSALTAWCLLVRPGLKRDDLPETIQTITDKLPPDGTLLPESLSIALLSGDVPRALRLANEADPWFSAHLLDLFDKLGLLRDAPAPIRASMDTGDEAGEGAAGDGLSMRDWALAAYADVLGADLGLWRIRVEYLASLENVDIARGRMERLLGALGAEASTSTAAPTSDQGAGVRKEPGEDAMDADENGDTDGPELEKSSQQEKGGPRVQEVLQVCALYGFESVARSVCQAAAEHLVQRKKYGEAVAYCVRANDGRKINRIVDLILDEYLRKGADALKLIDEIPTSLLRPTPPNAPSLFSAHGRRPSHADDDDVFLSSFPESKDEDHDGSLRANALSLAQSTRLPFLARYRDFHALYASGARKEAGELVVLLLSSGAAPRRFWGVLLLDSVVLLNDPGAIVSEEDTMEVMRCLEELTAPVEASGRDIYGHLECIIQMTGGGGATDTDNAKGDGNENTSGARSEQDKARVQAALRQLDVVRFAGMNNLARCCMRQ